MNDVIVPIVVNDLVRYMLEFRPRQAANDRMQERSKRQTARNFKAPTSIERLMQVFPEHTDSPPKSTPAANTP